MEQLEARAEFQQTISQRINCGVVDSQSCRELPAEGTLEPASQIDSHERVDAEVEQALVGSQQIR